MYFVGLHFMAHSQPQLVTKWKDRFIWKQKNLISIKYIYIYIYIYIYVKRQRQMPPKVSTFFLLGWTSFNFLHFFAPFHKKKATQPIALHITIPTIDTHNSIPHIFNVFTFSRHLFVKAYCIRFCLVMNRILYYVW